MHDYRGAATLSVCVAASLNWCVCHYMRQMTQFGRDNCPGTLVPGTNVVLVTVPTAMPLKPQRAFQCQKAEEYLVWESHDRADGGDDDRNMVRRGDPPRANWDEIRRCRIHFGRSSPRSDALGCGAAWRPYHSQAAQGYSLYSRNLPVVLTGEAEWPSGKLAYYSP